MHFHLWNLVVILIFASIMLGWESQTESELSSSTFNPSVSPTLSAPSKTPSKSPTKIPTLAPTPLPTTGTPTCFSSYSFVERQDKTLVRLDELRHGDMILSSYLPNGEPKYLPVIAFTGYHLNELGDGLRLVLENNADLILSSTHLLWAKLSSDTKADFYQASALIPGKSSVYHNNREVIVKNATEGKYRGWVTPLMGDNVVVVNGIQASVHTKGPHELVRMIYKPLQMYLNVFPFQNGAVATEDNAVHWFSIGFRRSWLMDSLIVPVMAMIFSSTSK